MTATASRRNTIRIVGPYAFAYNTAGINSGVPVYTPVVGDWLFDAWIDVTTAFDGTTPKADIGNFPLAGSIGLFSQFTGGTTQVDLGQTGATQVGSPHLWSISNTGSRNVLSLACAQASTASGPALIPLRFLDTTALKLCVSTTGRTGGSAIGGTAGAASLYLVIGRPS